jgi:hypothetical protein
MVNMKKVCEKAISKNDINIILDNCEKGVGKCSFYKYIKPNDGFVYFLMKGDKVVYIGASSNRYRMGVHQKSKDFDSFLYFMCSDFEHLHLETLLIRHFRTTYNVCNVAKKSHKF